MSVSNDRFFIDSKALIPSGFPKKIENCDLKNPVIQRIREWVLSDDCPINRNNTISIEFCPDSSYESLYVPRDLIYRINVIGMDNEERTIFIVKNFGNVFGRKKEIENIRKTHLYINTNNAENKFFHKEIKSFAFYPKIAWCERIIEFSGGYYIGIFHCARGESMSRAMRKIKDISVKSEIYFQFGVSLARFHLKFVEKKDGFLPDQIQDVKTLVHGDLHPKNVFYNRDKKEFWFIDYDHFRVSLETPETIQSELYRIYLEMANKDFAILVDGYSSCFPLKYRSKIKEMCSTFS